MHVYLLTALSYLALAAAAGAREPAPHGASGIPVGERRRVTAAPAPPPRGGVTVIGAGVVTAVALALSLVLPLRIAGLSPADAVANLPAMQRWLLAATLVYLCAGTVFYVARYRER